MLDWLLFGCVLCALGDSPREQYQEPIEVIHYYEPRRRRRKKRKIKIEEQEKPIMLKLAPDNENWG